MPRLERPAPSVFNALLDPLGQRSTQRRTRRLEDPQAVAQDYLQYMLSDYEERRGQGHRNWRDLCPVSRLNWAQAQPVVEDAWRALDHIPAAAVRPLLQ